jgi:hypothetical protein
MLDSAMTDVLAIIGVPQVPAVGIVSAFAGIHTADNVLNAVDNPGVPAWARVFAIAAILPALDVPSATDVYIVSDVPAVVGVPAGVGVPAVVNILSLNGGYTLFCLVQMSLVLLSALLLL